jgi:hypothetical protein
MPQPSRTSAAPRASAAFIVKRPVTGLDVQHVFDDDGSDTEDERAYVGVRCLVCTRIHLVSRKTGRFDCSSQLWGIPGAAGRCHRRVPPTS